MSTKTIGRPVPENSYYANARMVTVLICLLWHKAACQKRTLGSFVLLALFSVGRASAFYTALFTTSTITCGTARERGPCVSRTLSMGRKLRKRAITKRYRSKFEHL